jgi:hypothetical protein
MGSRLVVEEFVAAATGRELGRFVGVSEAGAVAEILSEAKHLRLGVKAGIMRLAPVYVGLLHLGRGSGE